ncbi:hypothetical protein [Hafnia paralvei]|uniref:hypothetical protein n=1 Tax=Hafnia paralvei TaxID=546367 RepID=UPI001419975C|nr:hypothetical protein [Hafnia paralvei]NIH31286.1 hypothetical protein [Hafnia paralvei]
MTQLLGDKAHIAIEYYIENKPKFIGRAIFWIHDAFLGSLDDTIFFDGYLVSGLVEILNKNKLDRRYSSNESVKIYELLDKDRASDSDLYDLAKSYHVSLGTWSDYFDVYSYRVTKNTGAILWKFTGGNDDLKDLINYPSCVFCEEFNYDELSDLIEKFRSINI